MKILVCVKQVPDMESAFQINARGDGFEEQGIVFRVNPYDEYALEEAVQIKESRAEVEITALSAGPPRVEAVVRRALELGADRGVHLLTQDSKRMDAMETASAIAFFAAGEGFHLLLFGVMSEDEQRCQTGPMTAARLGLPYVTNVISERLSPNTQSITVERELEGGCRETVTMPLPAVLTVQSGINRPRYPSLTNKLRARKQDLQVLEISEMPPLQRCEELVRAHLAPRPEAACFLQGNMEEQAEQLVQIIHEKTDVL
jgi:electron transfer flavoprotein beta subunit